MTRLNLGIMLVVIVAGLVVPGPATAQAGPDCVTPAAPDGAEPPCNPHLGQGPWAVSHRGAYAQASSPLPGPNAPAEQVDVFHDFLSDAPIQIQFSSPYADGRRVAWGSTVGFDGSIFKFDPVENAFIDRFSPAAEGGEPPSSGSISGAYNMIDRDDHLIVGRETAVEVYGDAIPGERLSPIARLARFTLPADALCTQDDKLVGLTMTADGRAAFATEQGVVGVVPRQPERMTADNLAVVSLNGAACGDPEVDPATLETVSNSIAADESGGIYIVTSAAQYRVDAPAGAGPVIAWRAEYPTNDKTGGVGVGGGGRLGVGSGSTPSLMGTRPGDDRFVAITDGRDLMHVLLLWRDEIPADWQPITDGYDRRIACEFPVTFGEPDATASLSEQSLLIRGNSVVVVDNYQQFDPVLGAFPPQFAPFAQLVSGLPGNQPTGLERIDWNPQTQTCEQVWGNPDISIPNGIPTMSAEENLIYGIGSRDGVWTLEGVDFDSGESLLTVETTAFPSNNSFYAATQVGPDRSVWTGNFGGITRFEQCDPLGGTECGRRLDPTEAGFGPPPGGPGDLIGIGTEGPAPEPQPDERPAPAITRAGGADRVATALALSARLDAADTIVLATAASYADALTGGPVAAVHDAPLLLNGGTRLDPRVADEISRLGPSEAIVMGGPFAVADTVLDDLTAAGVTTRRLAGADRFATAAAAAEDVRANGGASGLTVIAEGADSDPARGWPDAVTAAGLAATLGAPILLATTEVLPPSSADALPSDGEVLIIGGPAAIADAVADQIAAASATATRLSGRDRYETSAAAARAGQSRGAGAATTFVATGHDWPDALAAAAAAGAAGGQLLLIDGRDLDASWSTSTLIGEQDRVIRELVIVGGTAAITAEVADRLAALTEA